MKRPLLLIACASSSLLLGILGCDSKEDVTMTKTTTVKSTTSETVGDKVSHAADKTGDVIETGAQKTGEALNVAAQKTGEALGRAVDKVDEKLPEAADRANSVLKTPPPTTAP